MIFLASLFVFLGAMVNPNFFRLCFEKLWSFVKTKLPNNPCVNFNYQNDANEYNKIPDKQWVIKN